MKKTNKTDSYSHVLKYTGVFGGVQVVSILVGIIRNKFVAMILGPAGMGLVSLFNSTINLLSNSTNLGISMSAVKNISEAYDKGDEAKLRHNVKMIRSWCLLTALFGMFVCIVCSPLLSRWTFGWGDHTHHFVLLSCVVGMMAVTGGELAILKGTRHLRKLAVISVYNVIAAFFTSVPLYYFFGEAAIVPSLILMAFAQMLLTISYSYKLYPLSFSRDRHLLGEGMSMVKLGVAFVLAGILGSGAEFVIRSYLSYNESLETVGLFSAGYMMTITYASMVFSAMETDFFPRLSACKGGITTTNTIVNRQIEVSFLLISPMMVFFMIGLPILLPLLYTGEFTGVLGMMQVMVFAIYIRALKLPIAYLPLAKGDSWSYLLLEAIYDVVIVVLVILAFNKWKLLGCGIAMVLASIIDFVVLLVFTHFKYGFHLSSSVKLYALMQIPFAIAAYLLTFVQNPMIYWGGGVMLGIASTMISLSILRRKTTLWESLKRRWGRRSADD